MKKSLTKSECLSQCLVKQLFAANKLVAKGVFSKLFYKPNSVGFHRLAVSVGKKNGNAVRRNYIKRVGREVFRQNKPIIEIGCDMVWVIYPNTGGFAQYWEEFLTIIKKISPIVCK
jgi:ribonuclease P protein component